MMKGAKWMREASHLTDADRERIMQHVEQARRMYPDDRVGVRCPSYIGEPHPIATVVHGPGERIHCFVHRPKEHA